METECALCPLLCSIWKVRAPQRKQALKNSIKCVSCIQRPAQLVSRRESTGDNSLRHQSFQKAQSFVFGWQSFDRASIRDLPASTAQRVDFGTKQAEDFAQLHLQLETTGMLATAPKRADNFATRIDFLEQLDRIVSERQSARYETNLFWPSFLQCANFFLPLVMRFVREMAFQPASLLELSARVIKNHRIPYQDYYIPRHLTDYLQGARSCVNPNCRGVYFDKRIEHVKFVDFCGMYRIPLMQYLCSTRCTTGRPAVSSNHEDGTRMKRVLLG